MYFLLVWIIMGVIVAMIAKSKGKLAAPWFLYGALIWPIALVHALLIKPETGTIMAPSVAGQSDDRPCPHCAEMIKKAAKVCRFCNRDVVPEEVPQEVYYG